MIGTGGNAGNQASALVIRAISTGEVSSFKTYLTFAPCCNYFAGIRLIDQVSVEKPSTLSRLLSKEVFVSMILAGALAIIMFIRVYLFSYETSVSFALSVTLFFIVIVSVLLGTVVPIVLARYKFDPASGAGN